MADQGTKKEEEVHIVINFFESTQKPPQQASYEDGMKFVFEYVRRQPSYILGQLHKNLDPSGKYQYVNYVGFKNGDFPVFQGVSPPEWVETLGTGLGPKDTQVCYPGGYKDFSTLSGESLVIKGPKADSSCYVFVNFKGSEVGEANLAAFEADWKTKSGANIITESFPDDIKYGDVALYRELRVGNGPFTYVLRVEILPGASPERVVGQLAVLREKLSAGGIPYTDVSAYGICYICTPNAE